MNAQNEWMDTDGWKRWIENKQVDSDYHEFSHAEKLPSLKHRRGMNGRSVRPEPRERVSHLMSHLCFFFFCICFYHIPPSTWVYIWMGDGRKKKPPDLSIWWSQRRCDGCSSSESLAQMFVEYDNDCNASPRLESELCLGAESQIRMQPRVRMQLPVGLRYFRVHLESRLRGEKATPTTT